MTDRALRFIKLILLVVLFSSIARVYFLLINVSLFKALSAKDIFYSMLKGISADAPVIIALNLIFAVLYFVPKTAIFQNKKYSRAILSTVFWAINLPIIFVSLFNAEYYKLAGERIGSLSYASMAKMGEFESIFSHLLPRVLLILLMVFMLVILTKKYFYVQKEVYLSGLRQIIYFVIFVGASAYFFNTKVINTHFERARISSDNNLTLSHLEKNVLENLIVNNNLFAR